MTVNRYVRSLRGVIMMYKKKTRKKKREGFWIDVADFFIMIGEGIYYLFRFIFKIFD
jgi:hypothetical protein